MSSMLEQAIIDAAALKEAALKNAEQEVLERYSKDIKEAVDALLEQDDDLDPMEDPMMGEPMMGEPEATEEDEIVADVPLSALGGEKLCPCPKDEVIELDLGELVASEAGEEELADDPMDRENMALNLEAEKDILSDPEEEDPEEEDPEEEALKKEQFEINEQELIDIVEELVFEYEPTPTGWASGHPKQNLEQEQMVNQIAKEIAEANKENKDLKESLNKVRSDNNKLRRIVLQLKEKLDEVSVSNARLIYTNRVMGNDSLNERQKDKIVEKISQAQTIEEAKTIHEALQSAVAGTPKSDGPKSLNEAVSRQSTQVFSRRQRSEGTRANDQFFSRMQRLAGIKN